MGQTPVQITGWVQVSLINKNKNTGKVPDLPQHIFVLNRLKYTGPQGSFNLKKTGKVPDLICIKRAQYRVLYGRNPAVRYRYVAYNVYSSKGFPDSNVKGLLMHECVFIVTVIVLFYRMISIINNMEHFFFFFIFIFLYCQHFIMFGGCQCYIVY